MSDRKQTAKGKSGSEAAPAPHAGDQSVNYGHLERRIGYAIRRAQVAIFQDFFATFADLRIRPAQYSILTVIQNNPGLTQTQVATALGIKKTNFVAMIDALEKRGLVVRRPVPKDRRSHALFLAPAGEALMPRLHARAEEHEQRIIALTGTEGYAQMVAPIKALANLAREPGS